MKFFRNLLISLVVVGALLTGAIYFLNKAVENKLRETFSQFSVRIAQRDGFRTNPRFESAYFTSISTFTFKNFSTEIGFPSTNKFSDSKWYVSAGGIDLDFQPGGVQVAVRDLRLVIEGKGEFTGSGRADLPFEWAQPGFYKQEMNRIFLEAKKIVDKGVTRLPFDVSGNLKFKVGKNMVSTSISSRHADDRTYLEMDKEDVLKISHDVGDKLTRAEVDIVTKHPIQAPTLFRIKGYAKNQARAAKASNPLVPEGSYRHVLWNFLLTRQYGERFAKMVTDAHEVGDREGENVEIHHTDYHNNAIGRRWALEKGTAESDVLPRVLSDPKVIRKD